MSRKQNFTFDPIFQIKKKQDAQLS